MMDNGVRSWVDIDVTGGRGNLNEWCTQGLKPTFSFHLRPVTTTPEHGNQHYSGWERRIMFVKRERVNAVLLEREGEARLIFGRHKFSTRWKRWRCSQRRIVKKVLGRHEGHIIWETPGKIAWSFREKPGKLNSGQIGFCQLFLGLSCFGLACCAHPSITRASKRGNERYGVDVYTWP